MESNQICPLYSETICHHIKRGMSMLVVFALSALSIAVLCSLSRIRGLQAQTVYINECIRRIEVEQKRSLQVMKNEMVSLKDRLDDMC